MEPSKAVKEYKEELIKSQKQNERLTALVGKVTVEKEWLAKKRFVFYSFFYSDFFV
jgi:putative transposase